LIDAGLGPRQLSARLAAVGHSWQDVQAVLLTHTHTDHWRNRTLAHLRRLGIRLYCHPSHEQSLLSYAQEFAALRAAKLVGSYDAGQRPSLSPALSCQPVALRHDGGPTFGFRFETTAHASGEPWALGYVADLGSWTPELARALADVDVLALEFNHDVELERTSGRSPELIARVLSDQGHLSNAQAAALLKEVLRLSAPGRLRQVVQLHLSRDCNRPDLAAGAARSVLAEHGTRIELHTACQDRPGPMLMPSHGSRQAATRNGLARAQMSKAHPASTASQPHLPGIEV
jgi:phosphoribosyl 1,2-cyclic phosphodiesterase